MPMFPSRVRKAKVPGAEITRADKGVRPSRLRTMFTLAWCGVQPADSLHAFSQSCPITMSFTVRLAGVLSAPLGNRSTPWFRSHSTGGEIMFGLSGVTGWLVGRLGRLPMIAAGAVVLIVSALLAPVSAEVPMLAIALFLLGLGWNFTFVAGSSLLSDQLLPAERGRAQGAGEMAVAIGAGLGSLGSGFIFAGGGIETVSLVGLGFSLALLGMTGWVALIRRPTTAMVNN